VKRFLIASPIRGNRLNKSTWSNKELPKREAASGSSSAMWPMISAKSSSALCERGGGNPLGK